MAQSKFEYTRKFETEDKLVIHPEIFASFWCSRKLLLVQSEFIIGAV